MTSILDDSAFAVDLFYPRPDDQPSPPRAADLMIEVDAGIRVHARIHEAPGAAAAVILFHGNGEIVSDYDDAARRFAAAGARLAVVDYRGYGRSEGAPSLRALIGDARPIVDALAPRLVGEGGVPLPILVMGRSLGSACAAELARSLPRFAAGFVFESGFSDLHGFARRRGLPENAVPETLLDALCPLRKLARSHAPLLVLHGAFDLLIPSAEGRAAFEASAASDKRLVVIDGHGHNDVSMSPRYWDELAAFVKRAASAADRRAGSLVVQALGDAVGFLVEGQHPAICARFAEDVFASQDPPEARRGPFAFGQYSDDTQLARELALSLVGEPSWRPEAFAARVARIFATEAIVGRGRATEAAARRLAAGVPWDEAGEPSPSAGNGGAMRAAPAGLRYRDAGERLRVSDEQALATHRDPRARAAAILVADVVAAACAGDVAFTPAACDALAARVEPLDPLLAEGVRRIPTWLAGSPAAAADEIARAGRAPRGGAHPFEEWHGISPFSTPSTLYALYAFARAPLDPAAVLRQSVAVGGDVDTVAAMAGAMTGAAVGLRSLEPRLRRWATRLTDQGTFGLAELAALGHALT